jgi:peptidoglycan/LPS O-acetylase OafA/YrhL
MKRSNSLALRIDVLDYARFLAAVGVVLFHYAQHGIEQGKISSFTYIAGLNDVSRYGYLGVELFFLISGFVIFLSSTGRTATDFAIARLLRLYPAFIFCVLLTSSFCLIFGAPNFEITATQVFANLSMAPRWFHMDYVDGSYWTLILELSFYGIILLFIALLGSEKLKYIFLFWPIWMIISSALHASRLHSLTDPVTDFTHLGGYACYFVAGALFAMKKEQSRWYIYPLILICLAYSIKQSAFQNIFVREINPLSRTVIVCLIVAFYAFFELLSSTRLSRWRLPIAAKLGAATYPLYLIHQTIGYIILTYFGTEANKLSLTLMLIALMSAAAYVIHLQIEAKMRPLWKYIISNGIHRIFNFFKNRFAIKSRKIPA